MIMNMKKRIYINHAFRIMCLVLVLSLIPIVFSCKKVPLTNGKVITETRELPTFNELKLYDNIDVTLISSDISKIEITTGENLLPNIMIDVVDGALFLKNENTCNWIRSYDCPLEAKIYFSGDITSIYYESVGFLKTNDYIMDDSTSRFDLQIEDGSGEINLKINCNSLYITSNFGTNDMIFEGKADYTYISQRGLGPIKAENFQTKIADVYSYSSNNIYINGYEKLNAYIYNIGSIYYKGNPTINSYISPLAKGKLISIDD